MFTKTPEVIQARRILQQSKARPAVGTVIAGLKGLPVRIHCQIERGTQHDIFAYATMVHMMEDLAIASDAPRWYLRDFASQDLSGTKIILVEKARDLLLTTYAEHPALGECDVLPVASLRITRSAESKRSMHAEIGEFVSAEILALCVLYAEAAMSGELTDEQLESERQNLYGALNEA